MTQKEKDWVGGRNIHGPDLLKKYHQRSPLQDKKRERASRKVSSRLRTTTSCRTHQTSLLPVNPTNSRFLPPHTTTQFPLQRSFLSMSLGNSSAKPRSCARSSRSQPHHAHGSPSSELASAR